MTTAANEAISELFDSYGHVIYALGLRMCGDSDEASDLVQETFMNAFRGWDKFEGKSDPRTWIYSIAARACQRMHRKRAGEPEHFQSVEQLLPSLEEGVVDLAPAGDPQSGIMRREAVEIIDRALQDVPSRFRIVLVLHEIADLSLKEIAGILGIKESTTRTRLHRARLYLRKLLADELPSRNAPHPDHPREVCLNLLQAKQEAMDRGVPFAVPDAELCDRCRSLFSTLDLAHDACINIRFGQLPRKLQHVLKQRLSAEPGKKSG